jgi:hypothetical protein
VVVGGEAETNEVGKAGEANADEAGELEEPDDVEEDGIRREGVVSGKADVDGMKVEECSLQFLFCLLVFLAVAFFGVCAFLIPCPCVYACVSPLSEVCFCVGTCICACA